MSPKTLLLFLWMAYPLVPLAQSKYGYTTGLDTTALKLGLKSKTHYQINSHDGISDTVEWCSISYYPNGFIAGQQEQRRGATFEYNADGYLIGEKYRDSYHDSEGLQIRGPVANPAGDTSYVTETSSVMHFSRTERILEKSFGFLSDEDTSESKRIYDYDSLGRVSSHVHLSIDNGDTTTIIYRHYYLEKDPMLISKIESSDKILQWLYYYNNDGLPVECYLIENGAVYSRNVVVYQYY